MTPDRWRRVKELVASALELSPEKRSPYVIAECAGDTELLYEVATLVAAGSQDLLETPVLRLPPQPQEELEEYWLGRQLGVYRVMRMIGRGGMGDVYLARREDGQFEQEVAIKVVKLGMDSASIVRRFQRERQILASLAHPNIATLLDGGLAANGAPYFVMEYIAGSPLDDYCGQSSLTLDDKLQLFLAVCSAVQHAHRKLVVHGDLKAGNVLVNREGVPKLLDFGIARLLDPESTERTTHLHAPALTPYCASPEQLRGEPLTTASDVYSLGVLLCEISTGKRPYDSENLSLDAISKLIEEEKMGSLPPGDLGRIASKALRFDPNQRYRSADDLADDVQRFRDGRPVYARPLTTTYRLARFVQRRRWQTAFAALLLLAVVGFVVSERIQAQAVSAARDRAERRFQDVRGLAQTVIFELEEDVARLPGATAVRAKLVTRALDYLDRLEKESGGDLPLQRDLAAAYTKLGDVQGRPGRSNLGRTAAALASYRKAVALREAIAAGSPGDVEAQRELAVAYGRESAVLQVMGDTQGGLALEKKTLQIQEALLAGDPENVDYKRAVASNYTSLAAALVLAGDFNGVLAARQKALGLYEELANRPSASRGDRRGLALAHSRMGGILLHRRELEAATREYRAALAIEEELVKENPSDSQQKSSLATAYTALGGALYESGDYAGALGQYRRAQSIQEQIAATDKSDVRTRSLLATTLLRIGVTEMATNQPNRALREFQRSLGIRRELSEASPANAGARGEVAIALAGVADALAGVGQMNSAMRTYDEALDIFAELQGAGRSNALLDEEARRARDRRARLKKRGA